MAGAGSFVGSERRAGHTIRALDRPQLMVSYSAGRGQAGGGEPSELGLEW